MKCENVPIRILTALFLSLAAAGCAAPKAERYVVDPSWPERSADLPLAATSGVAVDDQDNVWTYTRATPTVRVFTPGGKLVRSWGDTTVHKRTHHIRIDGEGNVWLADLLAHVIRKCSPEGKVLLTLGTEGELGEDKSHFHKPTDMAITPKGDVFVSDGYGNSRIVHFDAKGKFIKEWGKRGEKPGEFNQPHAIALDSKGRLYVADRQNGRVQIFKQSGEFIAEWKGQVIPWGIWITKADEIWVCGSANYPVKPPPDAVFVKFNTDGTVLDRFEVPVGLQPGECNWLHAVASDSMGNVYCGDARGTLAQKFLPKK